MKQVLGILTFVSPFFSNYSFSYFSPLTNGSVTHNDLIYDFNNNGHDVAQQLQMCPAFMGLFNLLNRQIFASGVLSKVLTITSSVTRIASPNQNFSYNQVPLNTVSCSTLPHRECLPTLLRSATKPWIPNGERKGPTTDLHIRQLKITV